ncbi:hypothetical protein BJY01DRAFT_224584 [Aspergillus pseudoustus]|uniref:Uncharacterized protein n=1 Tax=Aspergillus pseudoustus TaxID=1810923 RepID=A0ABR4J1Z7_9EURO
MNREARKLIFATHGGGIVHGAEQMSDSNKRIRLEQGLMNCSLVIDSWLEQGSLKRFARERWKGRWRLRIDRWIEGFEARDHLKRKSSVEKVETIGAQGTQGQAELCPTSEECRLGFCEALWTGRTETSEGNASSLNSPPRMVIEISLFFQGCEACQ